MILYSYAFNNYLLLHRWWGKACFLAFYKHLVTLNTHITETIYCSSMKLKYIQYNPDANVISP